MHDDDVVRASELGEYAYCARAWWLRRVQGRQPRNRAALDAGAAGHRAHGQTVRRATWQRQAALWLLLAAGVLASLGLLLAAGPGW